MKNNNKKKKAKSGFKRGLFIYLLILILIFSGLLGFMWKKLTDFQANIDAQKAAEANAVVEEPVVEEDPQKAPQEFFLNYVNNLTEDDWMNLYYESIGGRFDSEETVRRYIQDKITLPGFTCCKAEEYSVEHPIYYVMNEDEKLAQVSLFKEGDDWQLENASLFIRGDIKSEVSVPSKFSVTCNGAELSDDYIIEEASFTEVKDYEEELNNPVTYKSYVMDGLLQEPEITVQSTDDQYQVAVGADGRYYYALGDETSSEYQSRAKSFIEALLHYYTVGKEDAEGNLGSVLSHVVSGSKASSVIRASLDGVMWRPADYSLSYNVETSNAYYLAENCYSVDVTYQEKADENSKQIYRVYFIDTGNGFGIMQFSSIDAKIE